MPSRFKALLTTTVLALVLGGCGGAKVVPSKPTELSIPPELAKAFEVKELPKEQPKPPKKKAGAKKKKDKKAKATAQSVAGPAAATTTIPNRRPEKDPIWVGEKIWMDVTWLSTKAGEFLLEVQPFKELDGRKVYDLKGSARTTDLFALIYKAEDWVQSFVDYDGWFPYKFVLHGDETKHIRNHLELFDHTARKQYVHIQDNRVKTNEIVEKKGFEALTPFTQDSLSALYFVRTFKMNNGDLIKFPMTSSGKQFETEVTVLGREEVNTKMGYVKAIKTKVITRFENVLQQNGDAFMWFTDDDRRLLVRFEAKVRIGWVAGIARKIELGTPPTVAGAGVDDKKAGEATAAPKTLATPAAAPTSGPLGDPRIPKRRLWFRNLLQQHESESEKAVSRPGRDAVSKEK